MSEIQDRRTQCSHRQSKTPHVSFYLFKVSVEIEEWASQNLRGCNSRLAADYIRRTQVGGEPILLYSREKREDNCLTRTRDFSSLLQYSQFFLQECTVRTYRQCIRAFFFFRKRNHPLRFLRTTTSCAGWGSWGNLTDSHTISNWILYLLLHSGKMLGTISWIFEASHFRVHRLTSCPSPEAINFHFFIVSPMPCVFDSIETSKTGRS